MKKLSLAVIACFFNLFCSYAQKGEKDTTTYASTKLSIDQVNFVSGYYQQSGNNSAVTGGRGTEALTDFANTLGVVMLKTDRHNRQYTWAVEVGIDHYTSASSNNIDPTTVSGPSSADTRIYPSISWSEKDKKNNKFGINGSYSTEYDYKSYGLGLNYSKTSRDNNREFSTHLQAYLDQWSVIYPVELRGSLATGGTRPRNSYSASMSLSQIINKRLQLALLLDVVYQQGLLATDYQRVYFTDNSLHIETLPESRLKIPIGVRANYFAGDRVILRGYYRYYQDNWGIAGHTASLEMPIKLNAFLSISPFYRYYMQNASDYFAPYAMHQASDKFFTSDYDLSKFTSHFFGAGIRLAPEQGVLRIKHWTGLEVRYGHYIRSNGLNSDIISLNANFK